MLTRLRTLASLVPFAVIPLAKVGQPAPAHTPSYEGYIVTMEFSDASSTKTFSVKVAGNKFRVELADVLPMMGRTLGGGAGTTEAMNTLGNIGAMGNGAFMFSQDSGRVAVVLPAAGVATLIDPAVVAGAPPPGRGRGGPGGGGGGFGGGGGGRRGGGGGGAGGDTTNGGGNGRARGRGGRGGAPPDSNARGPRRRGPATDSSAMVNVTVDDLGPGERMLGHPTRKYRIRVSSPLSLGGSCPGSSSEDVTTSAWFATDISDGGFTSVFSPAPFLAGGAAPPQGSDPFMGKLPTGMLMKLEAVCASSNNDSLGSLKVTNLEPTSFDADVFKVPDGIPMVDPNANQRRGRRGGGL